TLLALARDADARVRANAAWSLGAAADVAVVPALEALLGDRDARVAANAAAALGRIPPGKGWSPARVLCARLGDTRAAVRANLLAALRLRGVRCDGDSVERLLLEDPSPRVRA